MIFVNPRVSIPEVSEYMITTGPRPATEQIMAVFRGRVIFRSMMNRLNIIRPAVLRGELGSLPTMTGAPDGSVPMNDPYINWWAPYVQEGGEEYPISVTHLEGATLQRYPHMGISTEELLQLLGGEISEEMDAETEENNCPEEKEGDISMKEETRDSP